jgi:hypothetical protein
MRADLKFLSSRGCIDYSYLLGIAPGYGGMASQSFLQETAESLDAGKSSVPLETADGSTWRHVGTIGPLDLHSRAELLAQPLVSCSTGEPAFCLGMIDILEAWNCGWASQGRLLKCVLAVCRCLGNARGITAISPNEYAWRFDEFMNDQVLKTHCGFDDWRREEGPTWIPWA